MFEQEIEMEKKSSGVVPLLLIACLIVAMVGLAGYYVMENRKTMSSQEATALATDILKGQTPPTVSFHTGTVLEAMSENPRDARYRLLDKAGIIKLGKVKGYKWPIELTPKGEEMLSKIPEVKKTKESDGNVKYVVPLAERTLVGVTNIKKVGTGRAFMEFTWKWQPNELGEMFDASGALLKGFNTWDRSVLIDKHGANFYHADPTKVVISAGRGDKGWQPVFE
jgi:hypothetical protein